MSDDIAVLGKGLVVLEQLGEPRRISEIVAQTGLPKSTVHRLLTALRHDGWVAQNPDASYRRGWRWKSLLGQIAPADELAHDLFDRLLTFRRTTDCTMGFSFFRGATMLCDMRIQGDHEHTVLPELGGIVPFAESATGRVILGALPDTQMFRLIEQERQSSPELDLVSVMAHIRRTRKVGVSTIMKDRPGFAPRQAPRVTCWAAVILDEYRYPIGAVSAARVGEFLPSHHNENGIAALIGLSHEITSMFGSPAIVTPPMRTGWRSMSSPATYGFAN
ncbi:helix-turn-helix domain-containing protein [Mycobacterium sp. 21AC1]|uniref:helix-turn-helix domain-containing protein n=1 Tax=[Mycobacterium] appelbergii TaxID=2939269 RepID=UPI002938D7A5|nr:helix-turn-helix domain-containing protein [Mycobacterium sp. 21AC1]MDV3127652.1 helix-turn-helix domain-containing protein [Mycobacterium sp. 21AC1]